jgi:hypothetical protein
MWVRTSEGQVINLDQYQRLEVVNKDAKWGLVAFESRGFAVPAGDATAGHLTFAMLATWDTKDEAVGHVDAICRHLKSADENFRSFYDLRGSAAKAVKTEAL